jgi:hypothetical protein
MAQPERHAPFSYLAVVAHSVGIDIAQPCLKSLLARLLYASLSSPIQLSPCCQLRTVSTSHGAGNDYPVIYLPNIHFGTRPSNHDT